MRSLVVLFALVAVAIAAPSAEKRSIGHYALGYSPAVVSTPLEIAVEAEPVVATRTVITPAVYTGASAVSHQSRIDVHSSPSVVATAPVEVISEPVVATRTVVSPAVYSGGSAVSHQSRVDVHTSPAVVTSYSAPVVDAPAVTLVDARSVYPVYSGASAVSHQSRVDVETSPAVVSQHVVSPAVYEARSVYSPSVYASYW